MRVYIRNKQKYDPSVPERPLMYFDVHDFASTKIRDIKEHCQRSSSIKINELFYDGQALAPDRSVGHYNLHEGSILETSSNPFWVTCMYCLLRKAEREKDEHPDDDGVQRWTRKCIIRKFTLIGVLFNSKKEQDTQPPQFSTVQDLVTYLEDLGRKGAVIGEMSQQALRDYLAEYLQEDVPRQGLDPLGAFVRRQAIRLGYTDELGNTVPKPVANDPGEGTSGTQTKGFKRKRNAESPRVKKAPKEDRVCENCEESLATLYCPECQPERKGCVYCDACADVLHKTTTRRQHQLLGVGDAPRPSKQYCPHAYKAPFAIILGLYEGLSEKPPRLSMTEMELKYKAQRLTDTDLSEKTPGKYMSGFDGVENLQNKGFIMKEDATNPTYQLTEQGKALGSKLAKFHNSLTIFLEQGEIPRLPERQDNSVLNRRVCLVIDKQEKEQGRLVTLARNAGIAVQLRELKAGDYIWILTPSWSDTAEYNGSDPQNELVLPYIVERKTWDDFHDSVRTRRFRTQVENMKRCGLKNKFYLMEGNINDMRSRVTQQRREDLQEHLRDLQVDEGFLINYTPSWYKTVQWLLWLTSLATELCQNHGNTETLLTYEQFTRNVAAKRARNAPDLDVTPGYRKKSCVLQAQNYIDMIFKDAHGAQSLSDIAKQYCKVRSKNDKHLLVIQGLEEYNKTRQKHLNKCLEAICSDPLTKGGDIIHRHLDGVIRDMVHYDISSYWQLHIQVYVGIGVMRTENEEDSAVLQHRWNLGNDDGDDDDDEIQTAASTSDGKIHGHYRQDDSAVNNGIQSDHTTARFGIPLRNNTRLQR